MCVFIEKSSNNFDESCHQFIVVVAAALFAIPYTAKSIFILFLDYFFIINTLQDRPQPSHNSECREIEIPKRK